MNTCAAFQLTTFATALADRSEAFRMAQVSSYVLVASRYEERI